MSFYEIVARMKIKFGQLSAQMLCQFTCFAEVVNGIFGGKKDGPQPLVKGEFTDLAEGKSYDSAIASINAALRFG